MQAFLDTTAHAQERTRTLMTGIGLAVLALLMAWAAVRHMARRIARPLRRVTRTVAALQAGQFDARCDVAAPPPASRTPAAPRRRTTSSPTSRATSTAWPNGCSSTSR